ncbi:MAG: hypothetical protein ACW99U_10250 [Candidatus Thorarchaeota archaeon]|jgi:hypothetical protein
MKTRIVVLVLVLSPLLVIPVAANNQGLEWGVSVGARVDYTLVMGRNYTEDSWHMEENFYIVVSELQDIQDDLEDPSFTSEVDCFWENGTEFDQSNFTFEIYMWILPVGNWSLITEFFEASIPTCNETTEIWGMYWENFMFIGRDVEEYSKSDGMLNHHLVGMGGRSQYQEITHLATTLNPVVPLDLMSMGIGIASIAVVLLVVWRELLVKRRLTDNPDHTWI